MSCCVTVSRGLNKTIPLCYKQNKDKTQIHSQTKLCVWL